MCKKIKKIGIGVLLVFITVISGFENAVDQFKSKSLSDMLIEINGEIIQIYQPLTFVNEGNYSYKVTGGNELSFDNVIMDMAMLLNQNDISIVYDWKEMPVSIEKAKVKTVKLRNITKNKHKIKVAKGITEKSTRDDVFKAYGAPTEFSSNPESTNLTYESRGDLKTKESIKFEFENDKLNEIIMAAGVDKHKADNNTRFDTKKNNPNITKLDIVDKPINEENFCCILKLW